MSGLELRRMIESFIKNCTLDTCPSDFWEGYFELYRNEEGFVQIKPIEE